MKKSWLMVLLIILGGCLIGCHKADIKDTDMERTKFVKNTLLEYGMDIVTEVTPDTLKKSSKSTSNLVSFGKYQIYELSCRLQNDVETNAIIYHKFASNKKGKVEAEELFNKLKDSGKILSDSTTKENTDKKTGNKSMILKSRTSSSKKTTDTSATGQTILKNEIESTSEISVVLLYDAEKYEVIEMTTEVISPSDTIDEMINKEMNDMGWTY